MNKEQMKERAKGLLSQSEPFDQPLEYLRDLQDTFLYLEQYGQTDELAKLLERIEQVMEQYGQNDPCDRALLLNYKAALYVRKKEYDNAVKRMQRAITILEEFHTPEASPREIHLLANTYGNLSNLYVQLQRAEEAVSALRSSFLIRLEYAAAGVIDVHALNQQILNLTTMLILGQDYEQLDELLRIYENFALTKAGEQSLEYGVCVLAQGILAMTAGSPRMAEMQLLTAEAIITNLAGPNSPYAQTTYRYLHILYDRWQRPQLAEEYKQKMEGPTS